MSIRGNHAIVTGGSRGIGYAIAQSLAQRGIHVLITGTEELSLRQAAETLGVQYLTWDVSDLDCMQTNFERATDMLGGFDILVNNAGRYCKTEWGSAS